MATEQCYILVKVPWNRRQNPRISIGKDRFQEEIEDHLWHCVAITSQKYSHIDHGLSFRDAIIGGYKTCKTLYLLVYFNEQPDDPRFGAKAKMDIYNHLKSKRIDNDIIVDPDGQGYSWR